MAQDFGDDVGEFFLRHLKQSSKFIGKEVWNYFKEQQKAQQNNVNAENIIFNPESPESEYACVPFGRRDDAAQFLSVCQDNDIDVIGLSDKNGNGFLLFNYNEYERVEALIPNFVQEHNIDVQDVILRSRNVKHMSEAEIMHNLNLIGDGHNGGGAGAPAPVRDPVRVAVTQPQQDTDRVYDYIHRPQVLDVSKQRTEIIANNVRFAQKYSANLDEFRQMLAEKGIGMDTSAKGDNLFYEARRAPDGSLLPYDHARRDWAVTADTLKKNYGVDATHEWFGENMPKEIDGSLDTRGETADINQGIESHDGMDTNASTMRIEREQSGTDVAPSLTRKNTEKPYSLASEADSMRRASKQLAQERGIDDKVIDISDKLKPER